MQHPRLHPEFDVTGLTEQEIDKLVAVYPRMSGRTTRMIKEAVRRSKEGVRVILVSYSLGYSKVLKRLFLEAGGDANNVDTASWDKYLDFLYKEVRDRDRGIFKPTGYDFMVDHSAYDAQREKWTRDRPTIKQQFPDEQFYYDK